MEDWKERVVKERDELGEKITTLSAFLSRGAPSATGEERELLRTQRNAMLDYHDVLNDRISLWETPDLPVR